MQDIGFQRYRDYKVSIRGKDPIPLSSPPPLETFSFPNAVLVFDLCLQVYDLSIYLGLKL